VGWAVQVVDEAVVLVLADIAISTTAVLLAVDEALI